MIVVVAQGLKGELRVEEKKSQWGPLFDVEDPRSKLSPYKGKFLDVNQALEVARFDIQYLDWRARQDLLTIMLLHDKVCFSHSPLLSLSKSKWILECMPLTKS